MEAVPTDSYGYTTVPIPILSEDAVQTVGLAMGTMNPILPRAQLI
jgi:hypothetical protein